MVQLYSIDGMVRNISQFKQAKIIFLPQFQIFVLQKRLLLSVSSQNIFNNKIYNKKIKTHMLVYYLCQSQPCIILVKPMPNHFFKSLHTRSFAKQPQRGNTCCISMYFIGGEKLQSLWSINDCISQIIQQKLWEY